MAAIKNLSGVDVENFTRVDSVAKSDIFTIDDVGFEYPFIFNVDTSLTSGTTSNADQFRLLIDSGTQNFTVFWGDGTNNTITSAASPDTLHTYPAPGSYRIVILGDMTNWRTNSPIIVDDEIKITSVERWGALGGIVFDIANAFDGCSNLTSIAAPKGPKMVGDMAGFLINCPLVDITPIEGWDTSQCTALPDWDYTLNSTPNLGSWDTSLTTFIRIRGTRNPSGLEFWDTSSLTSLFLGFDGNVFFNGDVTGWDVSGVVDFSYTFYGTRDFVRDLGAWDVSSGTNFSFFMMARQVDYDADLSNWKINTNPAVNINFQGVFNYTGSGPVSTDFDTKEVTVGGVTYLAWDMQRAQNLSLMKIYGSPTHWDTSNVTNMAGFSRNFGGSGTLESQVVTVGTTAARTYTTWDVSNCVDFTNCRFQDYNNIYNWKINTTPGAGVNFTGLTGSNFSTDISTKEVTVGASTYIAWDTKEVDDLESFFPPTNTGNPDVSNWNLDSVTGAGLLGFHLATGGTRLFNRDINTKQVTVGTASPITYIAWDIAGVTSIRRVLYGAASFTGSVDNWNTTGVDNMVQAFINCTLFNSNLTTQSVTVGTGPTARTYTAWDVSSVTTMSSMLDATAFNNTTPQTWNLNVIDNITSWCRSISNANLETIMYAWSLNANTNSGAPGTVDATNIGGAGISRNYSVGSNMDLALNDPTNGLVAAKGWNVTGINIV
jgi:hypothetical protein